ncbi:MAG TPA: serine protease [Myxococcota bacterium]|nr:serine protease [Myxococcota bacterium]
MIMTRWAPLALLVACTQADLEEDGAPVEPPSDVRAGVGFEDYDDLQIAEAIYYGRAATGAQHGAVVSLHYLSGPYVYQDPFCSGTLITRDVVMTAAHCLDVARRAATNFSEMRPSELAIYVGSDPYADILSHLYTVRRLDIQPSYKRKLNRNDIALIELSQPITENVSPVPNLPTNLGWTNQDIGDSFNIAGFGYTQRGTFGTKLQTDVPLLGFGCASRYCPVAGYPASQVTYSQSNGGPCSGDSGGPLFVNRGGSWYVGGVTSYGDYGCQYYGVSTRVDAFQSWIDAW